MMQRDFLRRFPLRAVVVAIGLLVLLVTPGLRAEAHAWHVCASAASFWQPHDPAVSPSEGWPGIVRDASAWVRRLQLGDGPTGRGGLVHRFKRPTDGTGYYNNGFEEGIEVFSYDSPGGCCKVWYVTESEDAVLPDDSDNSGIPDFVERVAQSMEASHARYIEMGFRPPLNDETHHDRPDYGGDSRVDCYLMNLVSSDGYVVIETQPEQTPARDASGYMVMENDFAGYHYPSIEFAIDVLTSHELFHMFQNAYDYDQPLWWSEGTAEWATEQVFPDLNEWLHFVPAYMNAPEQSLHAVSQLATARPYGAVVWPLFLSKRFGTDVVRAVWEAVEHGTEAAPSAILATKQVLDSWDATDFEAAFTEFGWWLFASGERSTQTGDGYSDAGLFPSLHVAASIAELGTTTDPIDIEALGLAIVALPIAESQNEGERLSLAVAADDLVDLRFFVLADKDGVWNREQQIPANGDIDLSSKSDAAYLMIANVGLVRSQSIRFEAFVTTAQPDGDMDRSDWEQPPDGDLDAGDSDSDGDLDAMDSDDSADWERDSSDGDGDMEQEPIDEDGAGASGGCHSADSSNRLWLSLLVLIALFIRKRKQDLQPGE